MLEGVGGVQLAIERDTGEVPLQLVAPLLTLCIGHLAWGLIISTLELPPQIGCVCGQSLAEEAL